MQTLNQSVTNIWTTITRKTRICNAGGRSHDALLDLFIDKAHLALNDGEMFGPGGEGFMRLNVAAPRSIIKQALQQLEKAVAQL